MNRSLPKNVPDIAREVDELLVRLQGQLDAAQNPDRLALRHLGVESMGWTKQAYHDEAFRIWQKVHRQQPKDPLTWHHLAIMHHARAIDREASDRPRESDADWKEALELWARIWRSDEFWRRLAALSCHGAKETPVTKLREELPALLLQIHFDIALDERTQPHRATFHLKLARDAKFPDEHRERVRKNTYQRFLRRVPDEVWRIDELDPKKIEDATRTIAEYLNLDPGCLPALEDALRLQVRLLRARFTDFQAAGEEDKAKRNACLAALYQGVAQWRPYFDQLQAAGELVEEDLRQKLCLWYRVTGDVCRALDKNAEALTLFEQGAKVTGDLDERRTCQKNLGMTHAYLAREQVASKATGARAYCDRVRKMRELSPGALMFLANAYMLLEQFDEAEKTCRRGLALETDNLDELDEHCAYQEQLKELLEHLDEARTRHAVAKDLEAAEEHMRNDRFPQALGVLDKALRKSPEVAHLLFLRTQCHLALDKFPEARRDLNEFRRLVKKQKSTDGIEAADRLDEQLKFAVARIANVGGVNALRLQQQAVEAFNSERFDEAIRLLRAALVESKPSCGASGAESLRKELAMALYAAAVSSVNAAIESSSSSYSRYGLSEITSALSKAETMLQEAIQLDPSNAQARTQLLTVKTMRAR